MSSSSVYQGQQSCLGPPVIEPRILRLTLVPPGSNLSPPSEQESSHHHEKPLINHECDKKDTKTNTGGWSFLQAISNTPSSHCEKTTEDKVYVHPTVKRSSSVLSEKSLEMCTESLGSETGSNASERCDETSLFSCESNNNSFINTSSVAVPRRVNRATSFPPPLTSITDFGGVHVRPHREDGQLILEAVVSPSPHPYFHAERSDGRLRICLYDGSFDSGCDYEDDEVDEEWSHEEEEEEDEEEEGEEDNDDDEMQKQEGCGEEEESGVEEAELEECVENAEGEMAVNKFGRPSRCKESGNRDIFGDGYFELPSLSLCL